jgi:hypothetical protein
LNRGRPCGRRARRCHGRSSSLPTLLESGYFGCTRAGLLTSVR